MNTAANWAAKVVVASAASIVVFVATHTIGPVIVDKINKKLNQHKGEC
jgi:hypothetical protein